FPDLEPLPREGLEWDEPGGQGDSLAERLHLADRMRQENRVISYLGDESRRIAAESRAEGRRLVFFHDSFGEPMRKLLEPSFARSTCVWTSTFDPRLVEREKPAAVVELYVDEILARNSPAALPARGPGGLRAAF